MPTTPIATGLLTRDAFSDETTFGTPSAATYKGFQYYKSTLAEKEQLDRDEVIGGDLNNYRDARTATVDLVEHGGDLELPLCLNGIGDWLKLVFNAPTTTNVSADYTHVFNSGTATLPSRTIEMKGGTADFHQHVSNVAKSLKMDLKDEKGVQRLTLGLIGKTETLLTASSAGAYATPAYDPFRATGALVKLNGAQIGVLMDASWEYMTGVDMDRYVDGGKTVAAAVLANNAECSGDLTLRYTGQTYDLLAVAQTDQILEIIFTKSATKSLSILMPAVRLSRGGLPVTGPGGIQQKIGFRAAQGSAAPMITATLKNQIVSY